MRRSLISVSLASLAVLMWPATSMAAGGPLPNIGTAGNYAVLAAATITNTGPSWITGKVGLSPGTSVTGLPPGGPGTSGHQDIKNGASGQAMIDLTTAYNNAAGKVPFTSLPSPGDLGGKTLVAGTYRFASSVGLTGPLTLNGGGIYIFQIGSTLTTASSSRVHLINGAQPCDIFWQVGSSATIGTSTTFVGNILAHTSITMTTGATLNGRALAGAIAPSGAVTLDTNRIIQPSGCGYAVPAFVGPPVGNILPPNLGVPLELRGSFPWLAVIALGAGIGATALGVSARRRRRRTA